MLGSGSGSGSNGAGWEKVRVHPTSVYAPPPPKRRVVIIAIVLALALLGVLLTSKHHGASSTHNHWNLQVVRTQLNRTYPLSPIEEHDGFVTMHIAFLSDPDTTSKNEDGKSWTSRMIFGELRKIGKKRYMIQFGEESIPLTTALNAKGRGAELSELTAFNGKLFAADDRTGIIFEVLLKQHMSMGSLVPRVILSDGDGTREKGLKSEWMTVKDDQLWVGGLGRDWTTAQGEYVNSDPLWVKVVSASGAVRHVDWSQNYEKLKQACELPEEGYLWHEAVVWDAIRRNWVFMPRRASALKYDEKEDEHRGTNLLIIASEDFEDIHVKRVGELIEERGYSSFKIIPRSNNRHALAIKSEEVDGKFTSYVSIVDLRTGLILLDDMKISNDKIEGVEFI